MQWPLSQMQLCPHTLLLEADWETRGWAVSPSAREGQEPGMWTERNNCQHLSFILPKFSSLASSPAPPKGTQTAGVWDAVGVAEKMSPDFWPGQRVWTRGEKKWSPSTRSPTASPNTFDYFTLLSALQHMMNNESASSSAQKENKKERGDEILWTLSCLSGEFFWTQEADGDTTPTTSRVSISEGISPASQPLGPSSEAVTRLGGALERGGSQG